MLKKIIKEKEKVRFVPPPIPRHNICSDSIPSLPHFHYLFLHLIHNTYIIYQSDNINLIDKIVFSNKIVFRKKS